jgi:hypothetical protein
VKTLVSALVDGVDLAQNRRVADGNLGPGERRKRLILGVAALIGALGWVFTGATGAVYQRILLFVLFWLAALGLFQAKEKT